ncbi:hypothetical protein KBC55_02390 [Patescibacteria group bacterium]|nr:hypothetical protein [Patescibacteria group bacterium]
MDVRTGTDGRIPGNGQIVERKITVKEGDVALAVKEPLPGRVLIAAVAAGEIKKGAVLLYNQESGAFSTYNDGLYSAIRAVARHVPNSYEDEETQIKAWLGTLAWGYSVFVDLQRLPIDEQNMVRRQMEDFYAKHPHFRDESKMYARDQTGRAALPKDSIKRVNPMSRLPIIWSAEHRLATRKGNMRRIGAFIDVRARVLLAIRDQLDGVRSELMRVTQAFLRWRREPEKLKTQSYYVQQFEAQVAILNAIVIAPDGRRSFVRDVIDLKIAIEAIKTGDLITAFVHVDKVRRSLEILAIRESLDEVLTVASVAKERDQPLSDIDRRNAIATAGDIAYALGSTDLTDDDFERPVLPGMRGQFMVLQGELARPGLNAKAVYNAVKPIIAAA